jgi:kynurenine formamidase
MRLIDLTRAIHPGMPVYPGTAPPEVALDSRIESCGFEERRWTLFSHTGTHMDAPAHLIAGAPTLDQLPVSRFAGEALLIDCAGVPRGKIGIDLLRRHAPEIDGVQFLVLHTGWGRHWGTARYFRDYPLLTAEAAGWLAECRLKGVGVDAVSVDRIDSRDYPNHRVLLARGTLIIENLAGLERIPGRRFHLSALPMKFAPGEGAPVRAVAAVEP